MTQKQTFYQFLMAHKEEDSPKGDLVRDVIRDQRLNGIRVTTPEKLRARTSGTQSTDVATELINQWNTKQTLESID